MRYTFDLSPVQTAQVLSALKNRGDHMNQWEPWLETVRLFQEAVDDWASVRLEQDLLSSLDG